MTRTKKNPGAQLDREVAEFLIGTRAERLVYWNCSMDRPSFDKAVKRERSPHVLHDRVLKHVTVMSPAEFNDLRTIHLCDLLEQLPRCKSYRRRSSYARMARQLGVPALTLYQQVLEGRGG